MCPLILLCFVKFRITVTFSLGIVPLGNGNNLKGERELSPHTISNVEILVVLWTTPLYACSSLELCVHFMITLGIVERAMFLISV